MISYKPPSVLSVQVTGFVHITTQKDDIKVAKIILEVTGTLYTKVLHTRKTKKGIKQEWKDNVWLKIPFFFTNDQCFFYQNETFFSQTIIIEGSEKLLPQGNSKYKFEFSLPEDAKSSLKTDDASVSYSMECTADVIGLMGKTLTLIILTVMTLIMWSSLQSLTGLDGTGTLDLYVTRVRDLNEEIETLEDADGENFTSDIPMVIKII